MSCILGRQTKRKPQKKLNSNDNEMGCFILARTVFFFQEIELGCGLKEAEAVRSISDRSQGMREETKF